MKPKVFICHSSGDARVANEICARLEAHGIGCWIAPRDPVAGKPYAQQIVAAIEAVEIVLLVLSDNANQSEAVRNELELAANRHRAILPVRIEAVLPSKDLEFYVRSIHWFDAVTQPLAEMWSQLIEQVQRLGVDGDAAMASDSAAPAVKTSNLPLQVTSFVGREEEVAEICELLKNERLVTLVGTGGAGKTRVAIEVGQDVFAAFADGVRIVELGRIEDPALVTASIAATLGLRESVTAPLFETLLNDLKRRSLLLLVDNCEHVISEVRRVTGEILRTCAGVRILATSIESLRIGGERVFQLPSLGVPVNGATLTAKSATRYGSVHLFEDRAKAVDGRFNVSDANVANVTDICRRLDGIPLAIELAAARVDVLPVAQLAGMLDERFRVLTKGDTTALPRHRTMRALIDWSYDLLNDREQRLFRRISIFTASFTIDGAIAAFGDTADQYTIIDLLDGLVRKSLVHVDPSGEARYRMLESTRQYARERLKELGEYDACARTHLMYLLALFLRAGGEYETSMSGANVVRLAAELEDARAAFDWATAGNDVAHAADLLLATRLWDHLGLQREGIERARRLTAALAESDYKRLARLWESIALFASRTGNVTSADDAAERALHYARASGDSGILADSLIRRADILAHLRRFDEAHAALGEFAAVGPTSPRQKIHALHAVGLVASIEGRLDDAARAYAQLLDSYRAISNDVGAVSSALNLAETEHARGNTAAAIEIATKALPRAEQLRDRSLWAQLLRNSYRPFRPLPDRPLPATYPGQPQSRRHRSMLLHAPHL